MPDAEEPDSINQIVDDYETLKILIFQHVGYKEDWKAIPLSDDREMFWNVDKAERERIKFSPKKEALEYWLADNDDEYGSYGDCLYENQIYTQRFLPKWVYRGAELTIVCADTQTDGNKFLMILSNDKEIKK
jgi:hypothetical protein